MATAAATMPTRWYGTNRLAALGKLTIAALIGIAAAIAYIMFVIFGETDPMGLIFIGIPVLAALLMATGWRWTPVLAVVVGGLLMSMLGGFFMFVATVPYQPIFAPLLIAVTLSVLAIGLGIGATVQNYRRPLAERHTPRWLTVALLVLAGVVAGAILLAQVPPPNTAAGVSPELLETLPVLQTQEFDFTQKEIRIQAGETAAIRLENKDQEVHFFDVDELNVHAPVMPGEEGLALFKPTEPGTYTFYCAPHYDKKTGYGMKGTLIVEE